MSPLHEPLPVGRQASGMPGSYVTHWFMDLEPVFSVPTATQEIQQIMWCGYLVSNGSPFHAQPP